MIGLTLSGAGLAQFSLVCSPAERLIWNRTSSAPTGLYWLSDAPFTLGQWVVVSAGGEEAQWAEDHGFVGKDWPLLKQIAGLPGDEICRHGADISINGVSAGIARLSDSHGRTLPVWAGCLTLDDSHVFLMNPHPGSLDGRYFGPTNVSDIQSSAQLVLEWR